MVCSVTSEMGGLSNDCRPPKNVRSRPVNALSFLLFFAAVRLFVMRLVSSRQEAQYRGYRIEGVKQGEGLLLHVAPTRPHLPDLKYWRFRTLRSTWVKAVGVVVGYIDEAFVDTVRGCPPSRARECTEDDPMFVPSQVEELLRLNALLQGELTDLRNILSLASPPTGPDERAAS
jgi:hypothetical protein